jgi:hypothetical protein
MISKILVAMDGSEPSLKAYQYTSSLVKQCEKTMKVFKAIKEGWQDSLFDPFYFTKNLQLAITPKDDIPDARLIPQSSTGARIEFDANEPEAKVYFSLAHEIGQVLFPYFDLTFRNRLKMSKRDFSDQARKFRAMIYE